MAWVPLPKTGRGWVTALLLVAIAFTAYYLVFWPHLLEFYSGVLYTPPSKDGKEGEKWEYDLFVKVASPRHIGSFGNRWVHIAIFNAGTETLQDVRVWLAAERPEGDGKETWEEFVGLPSLFMPPSGELHFTKIGPREMVWGRLPVYATSSFTGHVVIQLPQAQKPLEGRNLIFERSEPKFLAHAAVENILLPPWSNGLLLGLAIFAGYLAEERQEERQKEKKEQADDDPKESRETFERVFLLVLEGLKDLALFFAIIFAVIALPWCFSGWNLLLFILFLSLLVGVRWILPQWERRPKPQDGQGAEGKGLSKFVKELRGRVRMIRIAELVIIAPFVLSVLFPHRASGYVQSVGANTAPLIFLAALNFLVFDVLERNKGLVIETVLRYLNRLRSWIQRLHRSAQ